MTRGCVYGAVVGLGLLAGTAVAQERGLEFVREGDSVRMLSLDALRDRCTPGRVEVNDPYYGRRKAYFACALSEVLEAGFDRPPDVLAEEFYFLRAADGYVKPVPGSRLLEPGGYLAWGDAEHSPDGAMGTPGWDTIDRRNLDPGPFYMVWTKPNQNDTHRYPWPYQLVAIETDEFGSRYPHTVPDHTPSGAQAWDGFDIFRRECIACHAINGEGGRVGPELNVPLSIIEYRSPSTLKAYIRNPQRFRYTSMPSHEHLSDADLDALIAYFRAMSQQKSDPKDRAKDRAKEPAAQSER